jgi:phosphoglycolate phosphatase
MSNQTRYQAILFDLDGTLTDSRPGIINTMQHALTEIGANVPAAETLHDWIGPPLRASFLKYLGRPELADHAVAIYREHYARQGAYENQPWPGILDLLAELRERRIPMAVATSKYRPAARQILDHFAMTDFFVAVAGPTDDVPGDTKAAAIATALAALAEPHRRGAVMVGDRHHDVHGARSHGLPCIGVSYGYGSHVELSNAGAAPIVASVDALRHEILG